MTQNKRPTQISTILKTLASGDAAEFSTELVTYITELEAKQPVRPARISTIMDSISSQYPGELMTTLEAYLTDLEAKQQALADEQDNLPSYDPENPPVWSQERAANRKRRRQERAIKKLNNYQ